MQKTSSYGLTFSELISPHEPKAFIDEFFGRNTFRVSRRNTAFYQDLFCGDRVDEIINVAVRVRGAVEILDAGANIKACNDYAAAASATRSGKSLRINGVGRFSRPVSRLARSIEQELGFPANVNAYITPGETQALGKHFDTHDVFVIQTQGSKKWTLFTDSHSLPLEYSPPLRGENRRQIKQKRAARMPCSTEDPSVSERFTLSAGDMLYIPRGVWHEAHGESESVSCHLTVGIQIYTYLDLLTSAISIYAAKDGLLLRTALPNGLIMGDFKEAEVANQLLNEVAVLKHKLQIDLALQEIQKNFLQARRVILRPILPHSFEKPSGKLTPSAWVRRVDGAVWVSRTNETEIVLLCTSREFSFPSIFLSAVRFTVQHVHFKIADLPDDLTWEQKVYFVQCLIDEELLQIVHG